MGSMRTLVMSVLLTAAAAPAAAQFVGPAELDNLRMQQEQAQRRAIDQANQLEALSARQRADDAALDLRLQRGDVGPRQAPTLRYDPPARPAGKASSSYPSIPDAALADSNRRVQDAARNRR